MASAPSCPYASSQHAYLGLSPPTPMRFRPTYQRIWGMSFPLIVAGISKTIVEITDTIFLARYGTTELAAIGMAAAIYGVSLFLALGLVDAIQIIVGRRAGEEQVGAIGPVFNQGLYLLALSSLLMIVLLVFVVPVCTSRAFASPPVAAAVNAYLQLAAFALLFQAINLAYSAFYVAISKTRVLMTAALVLAVTNISLDYLLIFGHLGMPELGIRGAALATIFSEMATFLFLSLDILRKGYSLSHGLLQFGKWDTKLTNGVFAISLPVSLDALVAMAKWFLLIVIIEQLGEQTLAAANIIFSCYTLFLIPIKGFSETTCAMVSKLIGQGQAPQLSVLIRRTITLCYGVVVPLLAVPMLWPAAVLAIFRPAPQIIGTTSAGLLAITLATVLAVPADTYYAALEGTGDTRTTLVIEIIIALSSLLYAWYGAFVLGLALEYILLTETIGWALCLLLSWLSFSSDSWQRLKI